MSTATTQVGAIARRSVVRTSRQPASIIPPLVFPIALMAVNAGGLASTTELPGFPTESFLAFALGDLHPHDVDRKSTRLNSSHWITSRMPSSA